VGATSHEHWRRHVQAGGGSPFGFDEDGLVGGFGCWAIIGGPGRWRLPPTNCARSPAAANVPLTAYGRDAGHRLVEILAVTLLGAGHHRCQREREVEITGFDVLAAASLRLAPVPRRPGRR